MTLLNAWISPAKALVAFDTMGLNLDGTFGEASKAHYLPHANLLIAGRGIVDFARVVYDLFHYNKASIVSTVSYRDGVLG